MYDQSSALQPTAAASTALRVPNSVILPLLFTFPHYRADRTLASDLYKPLKTTQILRECRRTLVYHRASQCNALILNIECVFSFIHPEFVSLYSGCPL